MVVKFYATLYGWDISNKIGYLEEDTIIGKVTYYDNSGNNFVIFDIALVPGDTLKFMDVNENPVELVVEDTATINGLKYIEFEEYIHMCFVESKLKMIESVGPNVGIHNLNRFYTYFENIVLCNYKSNNYLMGNELFNNECNVDWTGLKTESDIDNIQIMIFDEKLIVNTSYNQGRVAIYNLAGLLLSEGDIYFESNQIDLHDFVAGIYFCLIETDNKVKVQKFIIK